MNLIQKGHRHTHRGIIGIESAIVLIAFVIVAAALAFVVLNMGFATTQKAKTTIISSLNEASTALEVSGKVTAIANVQGSEVNATSIPLKVTTGSGSINLDSNIVAVKYLQNNLEFDNILVGTLTGDTYANLTLAFDAAVLAYGEFTDNPVNGGLTPMTATSAIFYWTVSSQNPPNSILERGEHAVLAIAYETPDRPVGLDKIRAEILLPSGATLTVERNIPNLTSIVTDLG